MGKGEGDKSRAPASHFSLLLLVSALPAAAVLSLVPCLPSSSPTPALILAPAPPALERMESGEESKRINLLQVTRFITDAYDQISNEIIRFICLTISGET